MNRTFPPILLVLLPTLLLAGSCASPARKATPAPPPRARTEIVLSSPARGERSIEVADLAFAYFRRTYYHKAAPRAEAPGGQRLEVADRRRECRCLRLEDWSKVKFRKLRQIEILYPEGAGEAQVRVTYRDGRLRTLPAAELYGGQSDFPPVFIATAADGVQEYPLVLPGDPGVRWPEETLVRINFIRR